MGGGEKLSTSVIKILIKPRAWPSVLCLLLYPCDQIDAAEVGFMDEKLNLLNSEYLCKARSLVNDESEAQIQDTQVPRTMLIYVHTHIQIISFFETQSPYPGLTLNSELLSQSCQC